MSPTAPRNSTNVRLYAASAPAIIALGLWCALVAILQWTGALARLHEEMPVLTLFACAVAALAYTVDPELRAALQGQSTRRLCVRMVIVISAASLHIAALVAVAPAAVVLAAACVTRAVEARLRTVPAASPAARRGAP